MLTGLGLRPAHPRWIQAVLSGRSSSSRRRARRSTGTSSRRSATGPTSTSPPAPSLTPLVGERVQDGADRSHLIDDDAFFDPDALATSWIDEDAGPDDRDPHVGVDRMGRVREIGLLCVPDLTWRSYVPTPLPPVRHPRAPLGCRASACAAADDPEPEYPWLRRRSPSGSTPETPATSPSSSSRQERVVDVAARASGSSRSSMCPNGLSTTPDRRSGGPTSTRATPRRTTRGSPSPAAPGGRALPCRRRRSPPASSPQRELRLGLPWGPANELARDAVRAEATVTDAAHDRLHELGVNVYRAERDGFRLTAGRTLSTDPEYRQLSVRRLMTMLRLTLERQTAVWPSSRTPPSSASVSRAC